MIKNIISVILFFALIVPLGITAQTLVSITKSRSQNKNKQAVTLLCHKWNINNTNNTPGQTRCFPADSISSIDFYTDGYMSYNAKRKVEGVWNYDNTRHELYIIVYGNLWKYKILSLTENELVLETNTNKKPVKGYLWRTAL